MDDAHAPLSNDHSRVARQGVGHLPLTRTRETRWPRFRSMTRSASWYLLAGWLCLGVLGGLDAKELQAQQDERQDEQQDEQQVERPASSSNLESGEFLRKPGSELAWVGETPIYLADVRREVRRALGDRAIHSDQLPSLYRETLELLINRQLVVRFLERQGRAATSQDVDLAIQRWQQQLESVGESPDELIARQGLALEQIRDSYYWTLSWRRMLEHYVTERNLERYFEQHRSEFDGGRVRVAQIFWRLEPDTSVAKLQETAEEIRRRLLAEELTFDAAARRYSQSPSAQQGGELGWIERHDPMPESFSAAAFRLQVGEISQPVVTTLGVHLIQCQEIEAGTRQWTDVRPDLERAFARYLFRWAADGQRERTPVRKESVDWEAIAR